MSKFINKILSLLSTKKNLQRVIITGSSDNELEMKLNCMGLFGRELLLKRGPWSSYILKSNQQEVALGPKYVQTLEMTVV